MAKLDNWTSDRAIKLMLIGNSGAGKTGALTSLVAAGYKLRIFDLDNGLDALVNHVRAECPDKIGNIEYMTFRDAYKSSATGPVVKGAPKAYIKFAQGLDEWEDGTSPASWGTDTIVVVDSYSLLGRAAFNLAKQQNPGAREPRQWYSAAQEYIETTTALLTAEEFGPNVICISHVDIRTQDDGTIKGSVSAIGKALGPKLPAYFNMLVLSELSGSGKNVKRRLKTVPTSLIDLKNPAPMKIDGEYPIETGLATIFEKLKS